MPMKTTLIFSTAVLMIAATPVLVEARECTCRYQTADVPEGQVVCMQTSNGSQMAQCTKVLNNTSWKFLGTPCPSASKSDTSTANKG